MTAFAAAISVHRIHDSDVNHIKIAVIDDGIDASSEVFDGKIVRGTSFTHYSDFADFAGPVRPFYVPAGFQGTLVATAVCHICPKSALYIARLQERLLSNGRREFTVESAAKVRSSPIESWPVLTILRLYPGQFIAM